jgi:hypothetical protein
MIRAGGGRFAGALLPAPLPTRPPSPLAGGGVPPNPG